MAENLLFWHWWLLAAVLLVVELAVAGGFYLLWLAFAATVVGGVMLVAEPSWQLQFALFAVLSVASMTLWHRFKPAAPVSDQPTLNRRGDSYVGRVFVLEEPLVNGIGKLRVDDTQWRISGDDSPTGTKVKVVRADGSTLHVEKVN